MARKDLGRKPDELDLLLSPSRGLLGAGDDDEASLRNPEVQERFRAHIATKLAKWDKQHAGSSAREDARKRRIEELGIILLDFHAHIAHLLSVYRAMLHASSASLSSLLSPSRLPRTPPHVASLLASLHLPASFHPYAALLRSAAPKLREHALWPAVRRAYRFPPDPTAWLAKSLLFEFEVDMDELEKEGEVEGGSNGNDARKGGARTEVSDSWEDNDGLEKEGVERTGREARLRAEAERRAAIWVKERLPSSMLGTVVTILNIPNILLLLVVALSLFDVLPDLTNGTMPSGFPDIMRVAGAICSCIAVLVFIVLECVRSGWMGGIALVFGAADLVAYLMWYKNTGLNIVWRVLRPRVSLVFGSGGLQVLVALLAIFACVCQGDNSAGDNADVDALGKTGYSEAYRPASGTSSFSSLAKRSASHRSAMRAGRPRREKEKDEEALVDVRPSASDSSSSDSEDDWKVLVRTLASAPPHPLANRVTPRGPVPASNKPAGRARPPQKWSTLTAILLATLTGSLTYAIGRAESGGAQQSGHAYKEPTQAGFEKALAEIREWLPEDELDTDRETLVAHGYNSWAAHGPTGLPGAVLYPRSTEDVVKIVKTAAKHSIPLIPYCAGTSLEGHTTALGYPNNPSEKSAQEKLAKDGHVAVDDLVPGLALVLDFAQNMNNIISLNSKDLDAVVQPGVSYDALNAELKEQGIPLFFPVDPAPGAQIGGMIGTGASGTNAVRLTVVLPNGEVIKTRQRAKKSSVGPDLSRLFIGAEGTLGIVTEATLKLAPLLPSNVAVSSFPSIAAAAAAARDLVQSGISLACVELLDDVMVAATNAQAGSGRKWPVKPSLFLKFSGTPEQMKLDIERTKKITQSNEGSGFAFARNEREAEEIWHSRKASPAHPSLTLGLCLRCLLGDAC
ncbi:hypothetical protein Rhopal_004112-T1 [Rhodotorula paludigena]|uniref:D-lactate dehydrogenase (cytochrome) n=1 Tax=Rhodotorula paludigena TaxID=86838 RepID=A0AAV5GNK2_9BASI|nr:hypothetical protein Rhopal_004112-T1 [Rhodotorula paludigena]